MHDEAEVIGPIEDRPLIADGSNLLGSASSIEGNLLTRSVTHARTLFSNAISTFWRCGEVEVPFVTARPTEQKNRDFTSLGVFSPEDVDRMYAAESRAEFLIDGFLPAKSIAIAAGESTIGKSALICQLGLCVAAGVPFLGMQATPGRVLYCDLENSLSDCKNMRDSLCGFLGIPAPQEFFLAPEPPPSLDELLRKIRPKLVIVDSLRSYRPDVTDKNAGAGGWLKDIRGLTRDYDCAFLIVHHLRKPSENSGMPDLESCGVGTWLLEMEGPRAFVNQTDVRIAVAEGERDPVALKVKWSRRVHGDSPLVLVERVFDEDSEPNGYRQLTGAGLLSEERRAALERLPRTFTTGAAKVALGRSDDPTHKFLTQCQQLGLIEKVSRGLWRKTSTE